jgi:hypothetical protein
MSDQKCANCGAPIREFNFALGREWLHIEPAAGFPTTHKGTAWRHCRGKVATPPIEPVDGATDPCPTPGYGGHHTAVGAGAISPPYRCHGCGTWFTLAPEPASSTRSTS